MAGAIPLLVKVFTFVSAAYSVYSAVETRRAQKRAERRARNAAADRNSRRNYRAATPEVTRVYGKQRIAGPYMFLQNLSGSEVTFLAFVKSASHEIEEFLAFYLDEDELTVPPGGGACTGKFAGTVEIWPYLGTEAQDVGAKLSALGATDILASDTFAGMAGFIVKTVGLTRNFEEASGNFSARFCGAKVETTTGVTAYSTNPAYCARDYLKRYQGVSDAEIDADTLAASVAVCDEAVAVDGGGTIPRYACNGLLRITEGEHRENLRALADAMAGNIVYASGKWYIHAGAWTEPTAADDYELQDIADEVALTLENRPEDRPNVVKGKFYSGDHNDQEVEYPSYEWARAAGEPERVLDLDLPLVSDHRQAQRIAKIRGSEARSKIGAVIPLTVRGLEHKAHDVARYTLPRLGTTKMVGRIQEIDRILEQGQDGLTYRVTHTVTEASAADFVWDEASEEKSLPLSTLEFSTNLSKVPTNVTTSETSVPPAGDPPDSGSTEVVVNWADPTSNSVPLSGVRVRLLNGGTQIDSQDIWAGVETITFLEDYLAGPLTVGLRAIYDDNSTSGEISATV